MKKTLFLYLIMILFSVSLYAQAGTAYITPEKAAKGSYSETIEITFYPGVSIWNSGNLSIIIPEEFPDLPTLTYGSRGELNIYYIKSGSTIEPVPGSNIVIDGRAITITAINMMPNDNLKVVYGSKDNGGGGVQVPYSPGKYYFLMQQMPSGSSAFEPLDEQPYIEVTMIDLIKSASATSVMAKNTFTYTLTYKNISNMYPINDIRVWDTLPQGLKLVISSITPTAQNGRYLYWYMGSLSYNMTGTLQIVVEAQPGIIEYGQRLTNTAQMEASDGYGTYTSKSSIGLDVFGVKLVSSIYATPSIVLLDQNFTVLMTVQNQGNYHAYNVSPTALTIFGSVNAVKVSGPTPASVSLLSQDTVTTFTWVYRATGSGQIYFSGKAFGLEGALTIESNAANSNTITLLMPTNTATAVSTLINTPQYTKTFNGTPTQEITLTSTPTPTDTRQEAMTLTPTNTHEEQILPTFTVTETKIITPIFTNTLTPQIDTPTPVKTIIPTATPDALVYLDKNYINPQTGEKIKMHYKVLEPGIVDVKIYNLSGEMIISFSKNYSSNTYDYFYWDGKNSAGKIVGRGIYFIVVKQKLQIVMKKIVILK